MGLFGFSLPKKKQITDLASRVYDQANPFDNGRTFQQRTPQSTQSFTGQVRRFNNVPSRLYDQANPFDNNRTWKQRTSTQDKSGFAQLGQLGGQTARGAFTVVPQIANSSAELAGDTVDLARAGVAQATGNWQAKDAALNRGLKSKYINPGQGILGTGGLIDNQTASKPIPTGQFVKTVGGKGVQGYAELKSLGAGSFAGKQLVNQGIKQGFKTQVPTLVKTGVLNAVQGGADAFNRGASTKDVFKAAAFSGITGTAADVGLGVAGAGVKVGFNKALNNAPLKTVSADYNPNVPNDPLENLKNEARKYKSTEEFVKANENNQYTLSKVDGTTWDSADVGMTKPEVKQKMLSDLYNQATQPTAPVQKPRVTPKVAKTDPLIQEYADTLRSLSEGNGVAINPETGARLTNNVRSPELKGKRMTKADWYAEAERQIRTGKADPDFMKYYNEMNNSEVKNLLEVADQGQLGQQPLGEVAQQPTVKLKQPQAPVSEPTPVVTAKPKVTPKSVDEAIYGQELPKVQVRDNLSIGQKLSPDRLIRENITQPIEGLVQKGIQKMQQSDSRLLRAPARTLSGIYGEAGKSTEDLAARRAMHAGKGVGELKAEDVKTFESNLDDNAKSQVWAALDPEQAQKLNMPTDPSKFTPEQAAVYEKYKGVQDAITAENLKRGNINEGQAANENYFKRSYSIFDENSDASVVYEATMKSYLGQFKGRKQNLAKEVLDTQITDPGQLLAKKVAESEAFWAMQDYGSYLTKQGYAIDTPKNGYIQLPNSKLYGEAAGKYVPQNFAEDFTGFQYNYAIANAYNDMVSKYDNWSVRKGKKEILTIFNPAVRLGNQISNRVVFSNMNGINPITFNKTYLSVPGMIKNRDPLYREAVQMGLTGTDVLQSDLTKTISNYVDDPGVAKKVHNWVKTSYSKADDQARVAAYTVHRKRGYSPQEAAAMTQRGFQDYKSVGFFYDLAAKTPLIGNAFVRFVADATRIAKNAAVDHPMRTVGTIAMWSAFVNGMSVLSGEGRGETKNGQDVSSHLKGDTPQEKALSLVTGSSKGDAQKTREGRFGSPKLPFTNISVAVQTPIGEINVARFLPYYQLNELQDGVSRYLPFNQSPVRRDESGKVVLNGPGFGDPLLGQFVQLGIDEDFRQKKITDPENNGQIVTPLSARDKAKNVTRFLSNNNLPMGRELDNFVSSYGAESKKREETGQTPLPLGSKAFDITGGKDIYGRERSINQSLLRAGGVKIEEYGPEQVKKQRSQEAYQQEKRAIEEELKKIPKEDQEAYKRLTGYYKLRDKKPNEFDPKTDRYIKAPVYNFSEDKWKEYVNRQELYDMMVWKKNQEANRKDAEGNPNGPPLQPEFDNKLSLEFRKQLISNKSLAPGEDVEADARMYSSSEWDTYQFLKDQYKKAAAKYYPKSDEEYKDEMVKHQAADFPEKPSAYKAYTDAYAKYAKGQGDKPAYDDAIDAAKEKYNEAKRAWTNNERKARGLPPISQEMWNNVTFGYESDEEKVYKELKYGKGYGGGRYGYGGGGGSDKFDPVQIATAKYLKAVSAKKSSVRPSVGSKPTVRLASKQTAKGGGKPKVSMKKSRV